MTVDEPVTITVFARRYGLSRATLLYYDRIGLLKPTGLSPAGYRLYGSDEAERMARINTFREAGIPLKAIQAIIDGDDGDTMEAALEQRLSVLNGDIAELRRQQQLVAELLQRESSGTRCHTVDVQQWVAMLEEAGMDEADMMRWHRAFERDAPEAHHAFLLSLGLDTDEIADIRARSKQF